MDVKPLDTLVPLGAFLLAAACDPASVGTFPPEDPELASENELQGDPFAGRFPMANALEGLPAEGELWATLTTEVGEIDCRLFADTAPLTVANFVGLARGRRPYKDETGAWVKAPFYDGLPFHRVVPGQFAQTGKRGPEKWPGFMIQDEIGLGDTFDRAGVMGMASDGGPNSGGAQFFITSAAAQRLDGMHTIFGRCDDAWKVREIEERDAAGSPATLQHVEITRR